jgi:hypothetical protein
MTFGRTGRALPNKRKDSVRSEKLADIDEHKLRSRSLERPKLVRNEPDKKQPYVIPQRRGQVSLALRASPAQHKMVRHMLRNNSPEQVTDFLESPYGSLMDNTKEYRYMLVSEHQYTSTAGGVLNQILDNDPSTTVEWTSFQNLFSLCRLARATYQVTRSVATAIPTTVSVGAFRPIKFAALPDNAGAPGSYSAIEDSPNCVTYNYAFDTSMHGFSTSRTFKHAPDPEDYWADMSTPSSSTSQTGCPGGLQIYGESIPVSTEVLFVTRKLLIDFKCRI